MTVLAPPSLTTLLMFCCCRRSEDGDVAAEGGFAGGALRSPGVGSLPVPLLFALYSVCRGPCAWSRVRCVPFRVHTRGLPGMRRDRSSGFLVLISCF